MHLENPWIKIDESLSVIAHHFQSTNILCACEQKSPSIVHIYHFDITNPQFGVDEQEIDELIQTQLTTITIDYNQQSLSSKFMKDATDLENNIRKRKGYKKDFCLYKESNILYLFGSTELVQEIQKDFQLLITKHDLQPCKLTTLSDKQVRNLKLIS